MSIKKSFHVALLLSSMIVETQSYAMQTKVYTCQEIILKLKERLLKEESRARKTVFVLEQKVEAAEKRARDAEEALALLKTSVVTPILTTPISFSLPRNLPTDVSVVFGEDWKAGTEEEAFYFADRASNKLCAPWSWSQESTQAMINYFQKQTAQHSVTLKN
jgi:hypothetical protein